MASALLEALAGKAHRVNVSRGSKDFIFDALVYIDTQFVAALEEVSEPSFSNMLKDYLGGVDVSVELLGQGSVAAAGPSPNVA